MSTQIQEFNSTSATACEAALSLQPGLLKFDNLLAVVLIILVLLTQSGVGLIA